MFDALGHLLPIAVAAAVSSVPIMTTILILLSPNRTRSALPFLIGWVLGIVLFVVAFSLFARAIPSSSSRHPQVGFGIGLIIIGSAMIAFAVISWRRRRATRRTTTPKWLKTVGSFGALPAFGFGFALNVRPKALLLGAAAGLSLRADTLTPAEVVIAIAIYTVISASTVAAPIVASLIAPAATERRLVAARRWIARNSMIVTTLIMLMVGVVIIGNGLTRL
jgi:hypothetical protein